MNAETRQMVWTVIGAAATAVVPAFAVPHLDNRIVVTRDGSAEEQTLGDQTSYTYQLAALADTLQTGAEFLIDVDDSVANAELIDDVYQALMSLGHNPLDARNRDCAALVLAPGAARDRLTAGMYVPRNEADATGILEAAFLATIACEPIDEKLRKGVKKGKIAPRPGVELGVVGKEADIITAEELAQWQRKETLRKAVIKVDDFPQDFGRAEIMEKAEAPSVQARAA
jgi:hypothetical protein